jgi:endonuclease/exonuclease/phosphatase (EEP) superfamily protein YafD
MLRRLGNLAGGLLLILVLAAHAGGRDALAHPALEALANFRLHLAALAAALAALLALPGWWRGAGLSLLAAAGAAADLGPVYDASERPGEGRPVTLLYANVNDRNPAPQALVEALLAADADILITSETPRVVAGALAAAHPYRLVTSNPGEAWRTAIWSRYPLTDGSLYLNNTVAPTGAAATVELGGGLQLGLIGAHFSRPFERLHMIQAEALGSIAAGLARPLVIAGDFNAAPWSRVVARAAEVTGARVLGGYRVTWKGSYPTPLGLVPEPWGHQIDQILLSPGIGVAAVETLDLPGSDHLGVLVRVSLPLR